MRKVKVEDAVGMVIAHDLTRIVPGEFKGAYYKKGHVITTEDVDKLKDMGKNHIYVLELGDDEIHENDAAIRIAKAVSDDKLYFSEPSEGKVSIIAKERGILKIDIDALNDINDIEMVILSTLHNNTLVDKGKIVAGTRIIPLTTDKSRIEKVEDIGKRAGNVISINPLKPLKVGVVVTGSEVYHGRITDKFGPVLKEKIKHYGGELVGIEYAPDDINIIEEKIRGFVKKDVDIILSSGGMSVDPDDLTPRAIRNVSSEVITYGSPILPGAMFMLGYRENIAIMGIPACAMFNKITVLDIIFPRVLSGERLSRRDITSLGHGGLCQNCKVCHYPVCPFGK